MPRSLPSRIPSTIGLLALLACNDQPAPTAADPRTARPNRSLVEDFVSSFEYRKNLHPLGFSARVVPLDNTVPGDGIFNTDLAFWGPRAYQGTFEGFRIIDISEQENPRELVNYTGCSPGIQTGGQGDVTVWNNLLVRSWLFNATSAATCGGIPVGLGNAGLHVFDVRSAASPVLLAFVALPCGSKAATIVPDLANNRLIVYSVSQDAACEQVDISEIPLNAPASARYLRAEPTSLDGECREVAVILGAAMRMACSNKTGYDQWSIGGAGGGSLVDPEPMFTVNLPGIGTPGSVNWSWDGRIAIASRNAGGLSDSQCQSTTPVQVRTVYFFDGQTGAPLGSFLPPRLQTALENCLWGAFSVVPLERRNILVSGNRQGGMTVVDFTDPANAVEIAYTDPAPLVNPNVPIFPELGGDWSAYFYRGMLYESDMTRGLIAWRLASPAVAGASRLAYFNPHTLEPPLP